MKNHINVKLALYLVCKLGGEHNKIASNRNRWTRRIIPDFKPKWKGHKIVNAMQVNWMLA